MKNSLSNVTEESNISNDLSSNLWMKGIDWL